MSGIRNPAVTGGGTASGSAGGDLTGSYPNPTVDVLKITNAKIANSTIDLTAKVTGALPVANGGTGSATQNFVDLTTAQTVAGNKAFTGYMTSLGGLATGLTAHAGGGQASALQLATGVNVVTTVGSGNDSVKLPDVSLLAVGTAVLVVNTGGASLLVFTSTATSQTIGAMGATRGLTVGQRNGATLFVSASTSNWKAFQLLGQAQADSALSGGGAACTGVTDSAGLSGIAGFSSYGDIQFNGTDQIRWFTNAGTVWNGTFTNSGTSTSSWTLQNSTTSRNGLRLLLSDTVGVLQLGADAASNTALTAPYTFVGPSLVSGGTSDQAGGNVTIATGSGKGAGTQPTIIFQAPPVGSTGTALTTAATQLIVAAAQITQTPKTVFASTDSTGTPGAATVNKPSGQAKIAASAQTVVITNSLVTASSIVYAVLQGNDATLTFITSVIPGSGSFTIRGNAVAAADVQVGWVVFN